MCKRFVFFAVIVLSIAGLPSSGSAVGLGVQNGWLVHDDQVVWGYAQHNGWWRAGQRANITRNALGDVRPNRTEDLDLLTDNMLQHAYPGFEHNFGLWYDRRRDAHDTGCRSNSSVVSPFLEQPWARSGTGTACDGLSEYDLTQYNSWYFDRLKSFAAHCDNKGTVLFHNFYMQHNLLETDAHYVDFPWRPTNCIQSTGMPDYNPAANTFYDTSHTERYNLHRAYIRKCLDELGDNSNVLHLVSEEYTGPLSFMQFWLDMVEEWEDDTGKDVLVCAGATKDVLDAVASDPRVSALDLRYFWYQSNGALYAPSGGQQVPGRYALGFDVASTTPYQIYRQVKEYRLAYPTKAIIHHIEASRQQSWAFLMGGGSLLIRYMEYTGGIDPPSYIAPEHSAIIQHTYDFINSEMLHRLQYMTPQNLVNNPTSNWCLAYGDQTYLVYALNGGQVDLDLTGASGSTFLAQWFDPRTGNLTNANGGSVVGGSVITFNAPDNNDWALLVASQQGLAPIIQEVSPDPDTDVFAGVEYTKQLQSSGETPITWSVIQGPAGIEVSSSGFVNNWTPGGCDVNTLTTIEIQALNAHGSDTETWQVQPKKFYLQDSVIDFLDLAIMCDEWLLTGGNLATDLDCSSDVDFYDYAMFAEEWASDEEPPPPALVISSLSPGGYQVVYDGLNVGAVEFTDRAYTFSGVPSAYQNKTYIKTANDDRGSTGDSFITFDINRDAIVYVAHDDRLSNPSWMSTFTDTGDHLTSSDNSNTFSLYSKVFTAGTVTLGGNYGDGTVSMYSVVVIEQ